MPNQRYYGDKYNQGDFNWTTKFGKRKSKTEGEKIDTGTYTEEGPIDTGELGPDGKPLMSATNPLDDLTIDPNRKTLTESEKRLQDKLRRRAGTGQQGADLAKEKLKKKGGSATDLPTFLQVHKEADPIIKEGIAEDQKIYGKTDQLIREGKLKQAAEEHPDNPLNNFYEDIGAGGFDRQRQKIIDSAAQGVKSVTGSETLGNITDIVSNVVIPDSAEIAMTGAATALGTPVIGGATYGALAINKFLKEVSDFSKKFKRVIKHTTGGKKLDLVDASTGMVIEDGAGYYKTFLESRKIDNSSGSRYSYRKSKQLKNPIYDNLSPKVQKGFKDAGIDSDKAKFFVEEWTREIGANIEGAPFTDRTFEFMQSQLLPRILEDMKGINLADGLQLDHIAQLKAMTPFYQGRNLKQAEKIRRILIKQGIFGGHNPKNLKYLPTDVHTVKTNFWKQNVGDAGEKFFEGRRMDTYADVEKAAKEMKVFINRSNDIVEKVSAQYKFMRKKKISAEELDKILKKVDLNYGTYNLKEVRNLIKEEINVDILSKSKKGLKDIEEAAEAVEFREKKNFLPHEIEDIDPTDIPKRKPIGTKKSQLKIIAEREFKKEQKRIEKLGGQTELDL